VPVGINLRGPRDDGPKASLTLWKNPVPIILKTANRFLEHFEESTPLGERNPSIFLRISLGLRALYTEEEEEQVEGGNYSKIGHDYLKGAKKRQRVWVEL
jgi:hypothetical protein